MNGEIRITLSVDFLRGNERGVTYMEVYPRHNLPIERLHRFIWEEVQQLGIATGIRPVGWEIRNISLGRMDLLKSNGGS